MTESKQATQADVARLAGVSQATVSVILNGKDASIPDETRQRVQDAIEALNYIPNRAARTLRTSKTNTIACIIPEITNPFYYPAVRGIQDVAETYQYDVMFYNSDLDVKKERKLLRSMQYSNVDGLVGFIGHLSRDDFRPLLDQGIAIVKSELEHVDYGDLPIDTVYVDNMKASLEAVNYLIKQGHQRIGLLDSGVSTPRDFRIRGYRAALIQHGIPFDEALVVGGNFTYESGYEKTQELLALDTRPEAIFAANDLLAIGAIKAIQDAGLDVPQDIAVMGFDNIPSSRFITPALSTVEHFPQLFGERAAKLLFERLSGNAPQHGRHIELPFELVLRQTA